MDIILFYLFFEGGLIPMFILIGVWGGERRVYAAFKFFLYTLLGLDLLMLVAIIAMIAIAGTIEHPRADRVRAARRLQSRRADLALAGVFRLVRGEDADVAGAHLVAGRARGGANGRFRGAGGNPAEDGRLRLPALLAADVSRTRRTTSRRSMFALSVIAIVWASLVAFRQARYEEADRVLVGGAHGLCHAWASSPATMQGIQGAIFQMLSHGIISGALFLCVGVVYDRMHTREIAFYGGLVNRMPVYAAVFMLFTMGNVGLPGTQRFPR